MGDLKPLTDYLEEQKIDFKETFPEGVKSIEVTEDLNTEQIEHIRIVVSNNNIKKIYQA